MAVSRFVRQGLSVVGIVVWALLVALGSSCGMRMT